ncbi:MAG: FHA domain-containing protein, partial [Planctomycetota bacterium JB042]
GKRRPIPIHEIVRESEELTTVVSRSSRPALKRTALVLSFGGERTVVGPDRPSLVIGRTDGCEIVIRDTDVSRRHASVELRQGAFYLSDHSTNGTYLIPQDGVTQLVRRQSVPLPSYGGISPGVSPAEDTRTLIEFWRDEA